MRSVHKDYRQSIEAIETLKDEMRSDYSATVCDTLADDNVLLSRKIEVLAECLKIVRK